MISSKSLAFFITLSFCSGEECTNVEWCNIEMPQRSYFRFNPPTDPLRWDHARSIASSGRPVFLELVAKVFHNAFDFLDGDIYFRKLHHLIDVFIDDTEWLNALTTSGHHKKIAVDRKSEVQPWEKENKVVIPRNPKDWIMSNRIPIAALGNAKF